jgi:hypothetical protein
MKRNVLFLMILVVLVIGCGSNENEIKSVTPEIDELLPVELEVIPTPTETEIPTVKIDLSEVPDLTFSWEDLGYYAKVRVPLAAPTFSEIPYYNCLYTIIFSNYSDEYPDKDARIIYNTETGEEVYESASEVLDANTLGIYKEVNRELAPWLDRMVLFGNQEKYHFEDGTLEWKLLLIREDVPQEWEEFISNDVGDYCLFSPYGLVTIRETEHVYLIYEVADIPEDLLSKIYVPLTEGYTYIDIRDENVLGRCNISLIEDRKIIDE